MKRLAFRHSDEFGTYTYDVSRIVMACNKEGYYITPQDAFKAWNKYSDSMCAGWMSLPTDPFDVCNITKMYCEEYGE